MWYKRPKGVDDFTIDSWKDTTESLEIRKQILKKDIINTSDVNDQVNNTSDNATDILNKPISWGYIDEFGQFIRK
jgi:hypothetical protein